jgi:hypothetical protein
MAERSEAKSAKQGFASKNKTLDTFDATLRFAILDSLSSAILKRNLRVAKRKA